MASTTKLPGSPLDGYAPPGAERPLGSYSLLTSVFSAGFIGALVAAHRAGYKLPQEYATKDIVLTGLATHKLSRLIARDKVTGFARAPFTRFQEATGHAEVDEEPRGSGLQMAIGELLVCPYCLAQWVAAAFAVGLVAAPRATRFVTGIYVAETLSDVLQLAYKAAEDRA